MSITSACLDGAIEGGLPNGSTTADAPRVVWNCRFCGAGLSDFAIVTQLSFGSDGIDCCRACSPREAGERLGIPKTYFLETAEAAGGK